MIIVENYYTSLPYFEHHDPQNVVIETGQGIVSYSIYEIERIDIFSLAIQHGFRVEQLLGSEQQEVGIFGSEDFGDGSEHSDQELLAEIEQMDSRDREIFMEELAVESDFWDGSEVFYE